MLISLNTWILLFCLALAPIFTSYNLTSWAEFHYMFFENNFAFGHIVPISQNAYLLVLLIFYLSFKTQIRFQLFKKLIANFLKEHWQLCYINHYPLCKLLC